MHLFRKSPLLFDRLSSVTLIEIRTFASNLHDGASGSLQFSQLRMDKTRSPLPKPDFNKLTFGHHFSDHMLEVPWSEGKGWGVPRICPVHKLELHPAAKVLHYASELFEGLKAYRGVDGKVRLFRPELNMERMRNSAKRCALPDFDGNELVRCLAKLVDVEREWIGESPSSMYIRPTLIGTEPTLGVQRSKEALLYILVGPVGPYFPSGFKPVSLLADPRFVRAWPGGAGAYKIGSNYGPTIAIQKEAEKKGCQQVLWLYGENHVITEVGTMNLFVFWKNEHGDKELLTPPLDGLILPGITRRSLLDLAHTWGEFAVTERSVSMKDIVKASKENRLIEIFGAGTACVVCPVSRIHYNGQDVTLPTTDSRTSITERFYKELLDIQYGRVGKHPWAPEIDALIGKSHRHEPVEEAPRQKRAMHQ